MKKQQTAWDYTENPNVFMIITVVIKEVYPKDKSILYQKIFKKYVYFIADL